MPLFTYTDSNGLHHESYEAACIYYGADTPANLAFEAQAEFEESCVDYQDRLESQGPTFRMFGRSMLDDEIAF